MSWLAKLYETYEAGVCFGSPWRPKNDAHSHTLQNAHIKIVIDGNGNFKRAYCSGKNADSICQLLKIQPGEAAEKHLIHWPIRLQYIAKDYPEYGGRKKPYFCFL